MLIFMAWGWRLFYTFNLYRVLFLAGAEASPDLGTLPKPKKPLKAMKMKRDPKKLRMGGGKVWEDHTLDDWDQGMDLWYST